MLANNIYHVLSRGVDKRKIFLEDLDYLRFIHDLFEFNDTEPATNINYFFNPQRKSIDIASPYIGGNKNKQTPREPRKLLVEILAFVLMPNHYHLLLRPKFDDGVSGFMKKLNIGYAKYFNEKYERTGALFEGRYKAIAVTQEAHFIHLPYYIHLNPLDLAAPEWRERKIKDYKKAVNFLEKYRWSSFLDYTGQKNFPSVTQRDFLTQFFGGPKQYKEQTLQWLKDLNLNNIQDIVLE
ncbi:MAG: hypothetical protein A2745_00205 [Candidatus Harrisonbacteria bacterium RIFCSPHIGHO2_01_FULL_44_13]|uniref:Transposase IS200-like domain-containing protein n=1 Tax=Candidatus Harrisonbacteria bacterium RIFCSPLOWO2_01_FULL_44_18 TaxID=1798407 RepID=A0A1G1ZN77_9BACT|nr:MAG: hypothetical protein A2745_00205 [Candidatus Harrisonbacteria bacterium RIFCSPHIGHO2_01_FULL_44_13]OGY65220.1 MAG: hypothetical protein A3A16_00825 [Candidatus Harrisonbacteria bacterium RIFCSPLOWO2_01_FULL_44_18]